MIRQPHPGLARRWALPEKTAALETVAAAQRQ